MYNENKSAQALEEIKQMMHRGSRFVSLSGWSGIAAGICALVASWLTGKKLNEYGISQSEYGKLNDTSIGNLLQLQRDLIILAVLTFTVAFLFTLLFTWFRSRKTGVPFWSFTARKVMISLSVPMIAGALLIWRISDLGVYGLVAPACLIFYGLALINASKFTLSEVRYLGYLQLVLGLTSLWVMSYGLYFWATGFGVLHILYGILMWNKYERNEKTEA